MVLGNASKKIQTIVELAEDLYEKVTELREQLMELRNTLEETNEHVAALEAEVDEQGELLDAIAAEHGLDPADFRADDSVNGGTEDGGGDPAEPAVENSP